MARPAEEPTARVVALAVAAAISADGRLAVHVVPNARRSEVLIAQRGGVPVVQVRTTAPPEDGRANAAVVDLIAGTLGLARSRITLERGATARQKLLRVERSG